MKKIFLILTILIIGISSFTHLYRIDKTFEFQGDEGRDAIIALEMIRTGKPALLGPEMSRGGVFLGPFYYYLTVLGLLITNLDPVGPAILFGIFGVITTGLIIYYSYRKGKVFPGLVAALFYATSPVMLYFSRSSWNPNVLPLFIILMLLIYPSAKKWQSFVFGLLAGIIFQLHYLAFIFPILLIIRDLYISRKVKNKKLLFMHVGLILVGFFLTSLPFWIYELTHNFENSRAAIIFISTQRPGSYEYPSYATRLYTNLKTIILEMIGGYTLTLSNVSWLTVVSTVATFLVYFLSIRGVFTYLFIASVLIISMFKVEVHTHYLTSLFPIVSLIIGFSTVQKGLKKIPAIILLMSLVIPYTNSLRAYVATFTTTPALPYSETARYISREAGGKPYNIVSEPGFSLSPILYYLTVSPNQPKNDDQELLFVVCNHSPCESDYIYDEYLLLNAFTEKTITNYLGYYPHRTIDETREIVKTSSPTKDIYVTTVVRRNK